MANVIHWASAVSGNFTDAADWAGGAVPGAADDAALDPAGGAFSVTASSDETVNGLSTAANATLALTGGDFTVLAGSDGAVSAGTIQVGDGAAFTADGTFVNTGAIMLTGAGQGGALEVGTAGLGGLTLAGGGTVTLGPGGEGRITASGAFGVLTNLDNTISGSGFLGTTAGHGLGLINDSAGVIDAVGGGALRLDVSGGVDNYGLMGASGGGDLRIRDTYVFGFQTGTILAAAGSRVDLRGAHLVEGSLVSQSDGAFRIHGREDSFYGLTVDATVQVGRGDALTVQGEIGLEGVIRLEGGAGSGRASLVIGPAGAILESSGREPDGVIELGGAGARVVGASPGALLVNENETIRGGGRLGDGGLTLVNAAQGSIIGGRATPLIIDTGANDFVNAGRIVATAGGEVVVRSAIENSGVLEVFGVVGGPAGALIVDGAVTGAGSALIVGGAMRFDGAFSQDVLFAEGGRAGGELSLARSQGYGGVISHFAAGETLDLGDVGFVSAGEATYSAGVLTVSDGVHNAHISLAGNYRGAVFTAAADGHGGVAITVARTDAFIAAIATLGAAAGDAIHPSGSNPVHAPLMAKPHTMTA